MNKHYTTYYRQEAHVNNFLNSKIRKPSFNQTLKFVENIGTASVQKSLSNEADFFLAEKAACYLKAQLGKKITLTELVREMSTNRNKLSRAFKERFGMSVFGWVREQRMLYAAELLETTSLTIMQIAEQVGYPDSNNFSTAFKRSAHMSPTQYRKNKRSKY